MLCLSLLTCPRPGGPHLLWNASASVPIGLYAVTARRPAPGALALARLPRPYRGLAEARGYLPAGVLLLKPVAGRTGDIVCRHGPLLAINGQVRAVARHADRKGRALPLWSGCRTLVAGQLLLLSPQPDSFDSRYFGPLRRGDVVGTAVPLWMLAWSMTGQRRRVAD